MILIPGSLSFAKLVMISSAPAKSVGGRQIRIPRSIHSRSMLSHTILTPICIRSAFFLVERNYVQVKVVITKCPNYYDFSQQLEINSKNFS